MQNRNYRRLSHYLAIVICLLLLSPLWAEISGAGTSLGKVFSSFPTIAQGDSTRVRLLSGNEEAWYARWHLIE
ncbi:MAG: hypothetical protein ACOYXC_05440, partial [Candidatus Rifleibacteriota bacterium]